LSTPLALARVRRGRRVGLLTDAMTTPGFVHAFMAALRRGDHLAAADGEIVFAPTERLQDVEIAPDAEVDWPGGEQSNSSVLVGRKAIMKLIRRLVEGIHPEAEMGRELTLRGFQNSAPMLGEVMHRTADGRSYTLAIVHGFVQNQGDGWRWTLDYVGRTLDELQVTGEGEEGDRRSFAAYRVFAGMLGRRLGEMHSILAQPSDDPDFAPKPAGKADVQGWRKEVAAQLAAAFDVLRRAELQRPDDRALAERVLSRSRELQAALPALAATGLGTPRIRIHGDLHLGQVLVTAGDVLFIDFEGEPTRPLAERRAKASPWRDVAGVMRSFDYASGMVEKSRRESGGPFTEAEPRAILRLFREAAGTSFLAGYRETAPAGLGEPGELLALFLLHKAAYEICYEAANRPAWLDLPLRGFAEMMDRLIRTEAPAT